MKKGLLCASLKNIELCCLFAVSAVEVNGIWTHYFVMSFPSNNNYFDVFLFFFGHMIFKVNW